MSRADCLIIGGGFAGTALAGQLLARVPSGTQLRLLNAGTPLARGLAYGTNSAHHLLNVPAARMSWDQERPDDFLAWLRAQGLSVEGKEFVPRARYGQYLSERLQQRVREHSSVHWAHHVARVQRLARDASVWRAIDDQGRSFEAKRVVLALGNFAPACPHPDLAALLPNSYVPDPWLPEATANLPEQAPVAIIGSGLTMLDLLVSLQQQGHRGRVLCLSRRGLSPQAHRDNELPPPAFDTPPDWLSSHSLRQHVRELRCASEALTSAGGDWRDLWVAMRARTPQLWQALEPMDRRRFLRHLQVYWDVHRHRAAPQALQVMTEARAAGRLELVAGRLLEATPVAGAEPAQVRLRYAPRSGAPGVTFEAQRVFNCTGPSSRLEADGNGLMASLQNQGQLAPCPHGLGLLVDPEYRVFDARLRPQHGLHYIGPMLRAQRWEATAVPELRQHAFALAQHIAAPTLVNSLDN